MLLDSKVVFTALPMTLLSLALGALWMISVLVVLRGLRSPTGVCPTLVVTDNALITKPKAGDVCLLGPEGS